MYTNESNLAVKNERITPAFVSLKEVFELENSKQSELINMLESKMHNVLNNRIPEKPDEKGVTPIENDFVSAMRNQLNQLQRNSEKLEKIIKHFDQIL